MTDHLPECQRWFTDMPAPDECPACEMFRACEERVGKEAADRVMSMRYRVDAGWQEMKEARAYAAGVQAAREAVEQASSLFQPLGPALAAIDALLEDK